MNDERLMNAALALAVRAAGRTGSNPNVGCIIAVDGRVVGRGWTDDGGRPHAEAMALFEAGEQARSASAWVTLEPCAHVSPRGPACTDLLIGAGIGRVVVAMTDPDPRTAGSGIARMRAAGIEVIEGIGRGRAEAELAGFAGRFTDRPELTLKLAMSLDGRISKRDGSSQWITGPMARAYGHLLRARSDMVVVGGQTFRADRPQLNVRLAGWNGPQPLRAVVTQDKLSEPFVALPDVAAIDTFAVERGCSRILVEGGGGLASSLLTADRVDRLVLMRAPILIGNGIGLEGFDCGSLPDAHGRWDLEEQRSLGPDRLEIYRRRRSPLSSAQAVE